MKTGRRRFDHASLKDATPDHSWAIPVRFWLSRLRVTHRSRAGLLVAVVCMYFCVDMADLLPLQRLVLMVKWQVELQVTVCPLISVCVLCAWLNVRGIVFVITSLQKFHLQFKRKRHVYAADWRGGALHYFNLLLSLFCGQWANKGELINFLLCQPFSLMCELFCSCGRSLQLNKYKDSTYSHFSKHAVCFTALFTAITYCIGIWFMIFHNFSVNSGTISSVSSPVFCWNGLSGLFLLAECASFPPVKPVFLPVCHRRTDSCID